jgi:uncharacterized protein (TIGR00297 family)
MIKFFMGFIFSFIIGLAAFKKNSLSFSGFAAAVIFGTSLYYFGGLYLSVIMVCFFVSSSILTKLGEHKKIGLVDISEKTGGRDYVQVFSNGGLGLLYAFIYYLTGNSLFIVAYAASFAAANADTWSSELGVLSKRQPVSILSFKKLETGSSGAVSFLGTFAALLGAGFIAVVFILGYVYTFGFHINLLYYFLIVSAAGFMGSIIDSILGATVQAKYRCSICSKYTEKQLHHGQPTIPVKGIKWMNNDAVNFTSTALASAAALILASFI